VVTEAAAGGQPGFPTWAAIGGLVAGVVLAIVIGWVVWLRTRRVESEISQSSIGSEDGIAEFQGSRAPMESVLRESLLGFDMPPDIPRINPMKMAELDLWGVRLME
jgi:hypothetical protein